MNNKIPQPDRTQNTQYFVITSAKHQRGVVLVVGLIMLLLMTLIGTTGMQNTMLQEKMAGNMRDRNLAFQAAESALQAGAEAAAPPPPGGYTCGGGLYPAMDSDCDGDKEPVWDNINWNNGSVLFVGKMASLKENPRYIIEDMGVVPADDCIAPLVAGNCPERYYRITARATGGTSDAVVMLQSVVQK
ncbi:hypothetical protein MCAMS1_02480 [biofilm metagenome]